jgi:hypothetical protein
MDFVGNNAEHEKDCGQYISDHSQILSREDNALPD